MYVCVGTIIFLFRHVRPANHQDALGMPVGTSRLMQFCGRAPPGCLWFWGSVYAGERGGDYGGFVSESEVVRCNAHTCSIPPLWRSFHAGTDRLHMQPNHRTDVNWVGGGGGGCIWCTTTGKCRLLTGPRPKEETQKNG